MSVSAKVSHLLPINVSILSALKINADHCICAAAKTHTHTYIHTLMLTSAHAHKNINTLIVFSGTLRASYEPSKRNQ